MKKVPIILLLVETAREFERGLLTGIARYASIYGPWLFDRYPHSYLDTYDEKRIDEWLKAQAADGVIMRSNRILENILELGVPTVFLIEQNELDTMRPGLSRIVTNEQMIGKMAADYFIDRGFRQFAYCGFSHFNWSMERCESFCSRLEVVGVRPHIYNPSKTESPLLWKQEFPILLDWLETLPKPIALMAANDDRGRDIIEACRAGNLHVPEEISVLGVDNDPLVCNLTTPALSSIVLNTDKAGFEAAQLMNEMLQGRSTGARSLGIDPTHVVTRGTTDITMVDDPCVAESLRFIRKHAWERIQANDVAQAVHVSRRGLYRKFKNSIGKSVHEEITRVRIEHIKKVLRETNLTVTEIAYQFDFSGVEKLVRFFRRETGTTPTEYRKKLSPSIQHT